MCVAAYYYASVVVSHWSMMGRCADVRAAMELLAAEAAECGGTRLSSRRTPQIKRKNDVKVLKYVEPKSPMVSAAVRSPLPRRRLHLTHDHSNRTRER